MFDRFLVTDHLEHWDALKEYFLDYLPTHDKTATIGNTKYNQIKSHLSSLVSKTHLLFVSYLCRSLFDKFLTWLQQEGPLIHLLHQEFSNLYRVVLLSFLSPEYIDDKHGRDLLSIEPDLAEKQLNPKQIRIGEGERGRERTLRETLLFRWRNSTDAAIAF